MKRAKKHLRKHLFLWYAFGVTVLLFVAAISFVQKDFLGQAYFPDKQTLPVRYADPVGRLTITPDEFEQGQPASAHVVVSKLSGVSLSRTWPVAKYKRAGSSSWLSASLSGTLSGSWIKDEAVLDLDTRSLEAGDYLLGVYQCTKKPRKTWDCNGGKWIIQGFSVNSVYIEYPLGPVDLQPGSNTLNPLSQASTETGIARISLRATDNLQGVVLRLRTFDKAIYTRYLDNEGNPLPLIPGVEVQHIAEIIFPQDVVGKIDGLAIYLNNPNGQLSNDIRVFSEWIDISKKEWRETYRPGGQIIIGYNSGKTMPSSQLFLAMVAPKNTDGDSYPDANDNCPTIASNDLTDTDHDGAGNVCDNDRDGDGILNGEDNCPGENNQAQQNIDGDSFGDVCDDDDDDDGIQDTVDNCPINKNSGQENADNDAVGDGCDTCTDPDEDGLGSPTSTRTCAMDNCPSVSNANQADINGDSVGDACDLDADGVPFDVDNCPTFSNSNQEDTDGDTRGDICESDIDNDGIENEYDNCPTTPNRPIGPGGAPAPCTQYTHPASDGFTENIISLVSDQPPLLENIRNFGLAGCVSSVTNQGVRPCTASLYICYACNPGFHALVNVGASICRSSPAIAASSGCHICSSAEIDGSGPVIGGEVSYVPQVTCVSDN